MTEMEYTELGIFNSKTGPSDGSGKDESLHDAKRFVADHIREGVICPCCQQHAKLYKRRLNATKAALLLSLCSVHVRQEAIEWTHVSDIPWKGTDARGAGGELAKLELWGLIERKPKDPTNTKSRCSGMWRATKKGIEFALRRLTVPKYVYTYNACAEAFSTVQVTIDEALDKKFNYAELMAR